MNKKFFLIISGLLICLFIYLFYRTENTVITKLFVTMVSREKYLSLREGIGTLLPLHELIVYALPEGLWVFCITITSKDFYLKMGKRCVNMIFLPLIFAIGLEVFQLLQLTNGRFDWWDIYFSLLFWILARIIGRSEYPKSDLLKSFTVDRTVCITSYLIVYLAHVWQ